MSADDRYEQFFAEKLWELVPSTYRHEDGIAERPGTLRAFIELIAEQAALLRRSADRLWDDAFIDLCDDWAVPYIGDLVATRMVSARNTRGRRVDVANTIYYRRRKGTPRILEELIADITGWEGKVVESFRFLDRCAHRLDPPIPERVDPSPGWADLHSPRIAEMADGPWDPFAHTPDVRKRGRWNIPKLAFHLFRLAVVRVEGVTPFKRADGKTFTFDPSGREIQLFMPRHRDESYDWEDWQSALPWQVPTAMGCRILGHAEYVLTTDLVASLGVPQAAKDELAPAIGARFATEAALHTWISSLTNKAALLASGIYDAIRAGALVAECGKAALWPSAVSVTPAVARERMAAASLADWSRTVPDSDLIVDPVLGRFKTASAPTSVMYWTGSGGHVGAGGYDRRADVITPPDATLIGTITAAALPTDGVAGIADSATHDVTGNPTGITRLVLQAANVQRPYLRLAGDWTFTGTGSATLVLEGLWIGASAPASIVLAGSWGDVTIRHSTLDPGGTNVDGTALPPVRLWVEGSVDRLTIQSSITAAIATRNGGEIEEIIVNDSIIDAQLSGGVAIDQTPGELQMRRVTVLGQIKVDHLDASEVLVTDVVTVTDTQNGCFRFSCAPDGSRLPHPYRRVTWDGGPVFGSTRFGDAGYAWLADSAPDAIRRGGEDGVEIGAWSSTLLAIKEDSLLKKVEEYLPFGLIPQFVHADVTRGLNHGE